MANYKFYMGSPDLNSLGFVGAGARQGYQLDIVYGAEVAAPGWNISTYINVEGIDALIGFGLRNFAFYAAPNQSSMLGNTGNPGDANGAPTDRRVDIPRGAKWVRFSIKDDDLDKAFVTAAREVRVNYKDDLTKDTERENNQMFYRDKLNGKLSLIGSDYDYLKSFTLENKLVLFIYKQNEPFAPWSYYFKSKFVRTDCEYDDDNKKATLSVEPDDLYDLILKGAEKEYDLIKLAPAIVPVDLKKRPILQVYTAGQNSVACFLGGMTWQQEVTNVVDDFSRLQTLYRFALSAMFKEVQLDFPTLPAASGLYVGRVTNYDSVNLTFSVDLFCEHAPGYRIKVSQAPVNPAPLKTLRIELINVISTTAINSTLTTFPGNGLEYENAVFTLNDQTGLRGPAYANMKTHRVFARYLLDTATFNGSATFDVPTEDITPSSRNYRKVAPYPGQIAEISEYFSTEPTQWGLRPDNVTYYKPPPSLVASRVEPVAPLSWGRASVWFNYDDYSYPLETSATTEITIRDTYPIGDVIERLLKQIDSRFQFKESAAFSQILYGTPNPLGAAVTRLLISPKTNVIKGGYDEPARKALITLQNILNTFRDLYKIYWHLDGYNLRMEHISYYKNGGTYSGSNSVQVDLTQYFNPRNNKPMSFGINQYNYAKFEMPERYQFKYMDTQTSAFNDVPIDVISKSVEVGKVDERQSGVFSADVDFILVSPDQIVPDGFVILAAQQQSGRYKAPIVQLTQNGATYQIQNGYLSFVYTNRVYFRYDMPALNLRIGGDALTALSVARNRVQNAEFTANSDLNPSRLMRTGIGSGEISKISLNLHSRRNKITLNLNNT